MHQIEKNLRRTLEFYAKDVEEGDDKYINIIKFILSESIVLGVDGEEKDVPLITFLLDPSYNKYDFTPEELMGVMLAITANDGLTEDVLFDIFEAGSIAFLRSHLIPYSYEGENIMNYILSGELYEFLETIIIVNEGVSGVCPKANTVIRKVLQSLHLKMNIPLNTDKNVYTETSYFKDTDEVIDKFIKYKKEIRKLEKEILKDL